MSAVPKPRRPADPRRFSNEGDGYVLHIPRSAFTINGFREWVKSDGFPDNVRVCFVSGEMFFDFRGTDLDIHVPAAAQTIDGFREWATSDELPEWLRVTFVRGEITINMSKEELETHNKVKTEVMRVLGNLDPDAEVGTLYNEGVRISSRGAEVSNNPDGVYVTWETVDAGRVRLVAARRGEGQFVEMEGSPDWVMEVVSNSSVTKDTRTLRRAYYRAGIREYWLIDARGARIDFQILVCGKRGYVAAPSKGGWQPSPVFGRSFRLTRRPHQRGGWLYRLEVRPVT
jgi:Uma2 family endonuclease